MRIPAAASKSITNLRSKDVESWRIQKCNCAIKERIGSFGGIILLDTRKSWLRWTIEHAHSEEIVKECEIKLEGQFPWYVAMTEDRVWGYR